MNVKTLHNSDVSGARKNVADISFYGDGDTFRLISKASSKAEGWMKSTKAMQIDGVGCVVQVTTQQGENVAEALTFVPGVKIILIDGDEKNGRKLASIQGFGVSLDKERNLSVVKFFKKDEERIDKEDIGVVANYVLKDLDALIDRYRGRISYAELVGCLECAKRTILNE